MEISIKNSPNFVLEHLPSFKGSAILSVLRGLEVPASERPSLLIRKLKLCANRFDFGPDSGFQAEKEVKRAVACLR